MNWQQHIVADPKILYGKPVIKNTRIPVDLLLEKLATGDTIDDLLNAYPNITREDITACLLFAAETVKNKKLHLKASWVKIIADESVDYAIIQALREIGFDVFSILERSPGIDDMKVLHIANSLNGLLITEDKDFGELTHRLNKEHCGILLLRLYGIPRSERIQMVSDLIKKYFDQMVGKFTTINEQGIRIKE